MRANSSQGFTLLEVLAALVIISLGMLGVIEAISQTAGNSTRMRDRTIAHWVAMNRLATVRLDTRAPNIDKSSDEVEMAGRKWRWTMEVTETPVKTMRRIDIQVAEAGAKEGSSLTSVTGFYGTAIAAPGLSAPVWTGSPIQNIPPGAEQPGTDGSNGDDQIQEPVTPGDGDGETIDPPVTETEVPQ